jgi:hypothetical protein
MTTLSLNADRKAGAAMQTVARHIISRSERIESLPEKFQSYVQFNAQNKQVSGAQFTDISFSGMRLISRHRNMLRIGDLINVEFALPGSEQKFKARAKVTRCENEFSFAVHFVSIEDGEKYRKALNHFNVIAKRGSVRWAAISALQWMHDHQQGLTLFFFALLLTAAAFGLIALSSDEIQGRGLRSW